MCALHSGYLLAVCFEIVRKFVILPFNLCCLGAMLNCSKKLPCEMAKDPRATEPAANDNTTVIKLKSCNSSKTNLMVQNVFEIARNYLCNFDCFGEETNARYLLTVYIEAVRKFVILPIKLCFLGAMLNRSKEVLPCEVDKNPHATEPTNDNTTIIKLKSYNSSNLMVHNVFQIARNRLWNFDFFGEEINMTTTTNLITSAAEEQYFQWANEETRLSRKELVSGFGKQCRLDDNSALVHGVIEEWIQISK